MIFRWFSTSPGKVFANELAAFILKDLRGATHQRDAKFAARAEKVLVAAARRLQAFKAKHPLNMWTRSRLANTFLWALRDTGCPPDYADELAEWLTLRL